MPFSSAHPSLQKALAARNYVEPTPVQAQILAAEVGERDVLVSAQTGSGKTVAFGLALAPTLLGAEAKFGSAGHPRALIVTPTRELALQVHRELTWLYADTGARIATCVGGMDPRREQYMLSHGVHIVVGTPGRLCDHLERKALLLDQLSAVVLDEADEMLDMGFREDLERLLDAAPAARRTLMFSATIPKPIATMAKKYQKDALRIAATSEGDRHRDIEYHAIPIIPRERDLVVVNLLRYYEAAGALVFCATRDGVTHLAANLAERGFAVAALSGELSQRERNQALQALRDGRARVCVATDVAARGLDLPDLGLVIHADPPQNGQVLVHRSGRTGRAGKHGLAVLLVPDMARRFADRMLQGARVQAQWKLAPSSDDVRAKDQEKLAGEIGALTKDLADADRAVAKQLLETHSAEDLVAALVAFRRDARPAPEELTVPPSMRAGGAARVERQKHDRYGNTRDSRDTRDHRDARPAPRHEAPVERPRPKHDAAPAAEKHDGPKHDRFAKPPLPARAERAERPVREHAPRDDERPAHRGGPGGVWFTVNVGRYKNADPKWIVPLLCRRGGISKSAIGKIQILARETRVEIAPEFSARFAEAVRKPDEQDRNIHIEPLDG